MLDLLRELRLRDKLTPSRNPEASWCCIFLPALIGYFMLLTKLLNTKPAIGSFEILQPSFNKLLYPDVKSMEIIASGMLWTEGPLYIDDESAGIKYLLYSDTRHNRVYRWEEGKGFFTVGKTLYMLNSGCRNASFCDTMYEPGSNGLLRLATSPGATKAASSLPTSIDLLVCQHGERSISFIRENGTRSYLATHDKKGRRLNSPNDLIWSPDGNLYFTDPPYGLYNLNKDDELVEQEIPYSGVYMIRGSDIQDSLRSGIPTPKVTLLDNKLSRPNGLGFSPDFSKLYISNSDENNPIWKVYDINDDGTVKNERIFFNATDLIIQDKKQNRFSYVGLPDGLVVDIEGNVFASGPGGILVISSKGELIGRINIDRPVSNLAFGGDGRLYITATDLVVRFYIKTKPIRVLTKHK